MTVRLSRNTRATLKILLGGLLQAPEVARRLALLRKFHRKPLREMLRQQRRRESVDPHFEPITEAQYEVLEKAAPKVRGKVLSSILEPKNDSPS